MPCYSVCRLRPRFVHRAFPSTPLLPPLPAFPWSCFLPLLLLPPLPPFPWAPPTADVRCCLLSCASSSCHLTMNHSAASRTSRYHFPASFAAVDRSAVSIPNTTGECSVDPSMGRNSLRSSTMHLCQVSNCPPGLGFSPPAIVSNITRLGNRSMLYRATPTAKKSRRLRMVVSMLSQRCHLESPLRS